MYVHFKTKNKFEGTSQSKVGWKEVLQKPGVDYAEKYFWMARFISIRVLMVLQPTNRFGVIPTD